MKEKVIQKFMVTTAVLTGMGLATITQANAATTDQATTTSSNSQVGAATAGLSATSEELMYSQQDYTTAANALTKAQNDLVIAKKGGNTADIQVAQAAVTSAQTKLKTAQQTLQKNKNSLTAAKSRYQALTASDAKDPNNAAISIAQLAAASEEQMYAKIDLTKAQTAVQTAQQALTQAQSTNKGIVAAKSALATAKAQLAQAKTNYQKRHNTVIAAKARTNALNPNGYGQISSAATNRTGAVANSNTST